MSGPVLRWPGSKWRMAEMIVTHLPQHGAYVEPFFGSGAVFFKKPPSRVEIINDADGEVVNLFQVIREQPEALAALLTATPWARDEYRECSSSTDLSTLTPLERARRLVVISQQSHGIRSYDRHNGNGWRVHDHHRNTAYFRWFKLPERVMVAAQRLQDAQIENIDALALIRRVASPDTLIYADPPYLRTTRSTATLYRREMTSPEAHSDLLATLQHHPGPVLLSHYPNDLYDDALSSWHHIDVTARVQSNESRVERVYINPVAWERLRLEQSAAQAAEEAERARNSTPLFGSAT